MPANKREFPDSEARIRAAGDFSKSLCVEAGAGTGKTTILVERIMNLLLDGRARIGEIAAITFTEMAAGELKMRIREELERAARSERGGSERIRKALEELDAARISTIHSLASSIISERPVEAGVDVGFEVIEHEQVEEFFDGVYDKWIAVETGKNPPALTAAVAADFPVEKIRDLARALAGLRASADGTVKFSMSADEALEIYGTRLRDAAAEIKGILSCAKDPSDKGAVKCSEIIRFSGEYFSGSAEALVELCGISNRAVGKKNSWTPADACDRQKELCSEAVESARRIGGLKRAKVLEGLVEWLAGFTRKYHAEKRRRGFMEFDDLLVCARNLLRENAEVREYFKNKFKCVLVDEFQDTEEIQAELVFFLSEKPAAGKSLERNWKKISVQPGKLFIVGDPKQSIYRFRGADVESYELAKGAVLASGGDALYITQNFRSHAGVIGWVNSGFSNVMKREEGRLFQSEYIPLEPLKERRNFGKGLMYLMPPPEFRGEGADVKKIRVGDLLMREARFIAAAIKNVVGNKNYEFVPKGEKSPRPFKFGDIAVLLPKTTAWAVYEEWLAAAGIPYRFEGGKEFFRRPEMVKIRRALTAIERPWDELSVFAALRSEFFGASDREIAEHAANFHSLDYMKYKKESGSPLEEPFAILRELHLQKDSRPASATIAELLEKTGALRSFAAKPHGLQAAANLLKAVETARELEDAGDGGFGRFVRKMKYFSDVSIEERDSPVFEEGDDSVRVLTFHKAKGLEFPAVVLGMLYTGKGGGGGGVRVIKDPARGTVEIRVPFGKNEEFASAAFDEKAGEWDAPREDAEEKRRFYVAATRARDMLVLPFFTKGDKREVCAEMLRQMFPECRIPGVPDEGVEILYEKDAPVVPEPGPAVFVNPDWKIGPEAERILDERGIVMKRLDEARKAPRSAPDLAARPSERGEEPKIDMVEIGAVKLKGPAADLGTAFHELMERVGPGFKGDIDAEAKRAAADNGVKEFAAELARFARTVLKSDVLKRAAAAKKVYLETPFAVRTPAGIKSGRIDLIFLERDEAVIVDYKTDFGAPAELRKSFEEKYRSQGADYAAALSSAGGVKVKEVVFLFARTGAEMKFTPNSPK
jgi:ATP-dependent helicase/nuclease subunit A